MSKAISYENKLIASTALGVFGGKPLVRTYADENNISKIDILSCQDRPYNLVTSYSTIGLSDYSIGLIVGENPLGIELVGACGSEFEKYPNVISTCAFDIINSHFQCYPDAVFRRIVEMYYPPFSMKHILFVSPFGWDREFQTLEFPTKKVAWLLAVPISEAEYQFAQDKGIDLLKSLFEEKQIDFYNLNRPSVL